VGGPQERFLHAHGTILHGPGLQDSENNEIGVLIVLNDVTRIRRLDIIRKDFVANVSHELKTPITSIKGFVETLLDGAYEKPEDAKRFLEIIAKQTNRLNAIIEDLLSLSRIEQDDEKIELALTPVKQVLTAATQVCELNSKAKKIRVNLDCPENLKATINPHLLEQAVVNLIDNSIKYSKPQSEIQISATQKDQKISIQVRDNGCGIAEEDLPRLFERFYRVDKSRSRELGGTGLGLAIVKHIVQTHQGTITVESQLDQGSTFTIQLPTP
jgi:two-component system phosphate regulon sensor histidine kinase PhoR